VQPRRAILEAAGPIGLAHQEQEGLAMPHRERSEVLVVAHVRAEGALPGHYPRPPKSRRRRSLPVCWRG
jgi:hypothetical protein